MRDIKFRQPLRKSDGAFTEWFYWGFIDGDFVSPAMQLNAIDTRKESQQFTGMTDNWKKEIWEGDRVKILYTDWPSKTNDDPRNLDQYLEDISLAGEVVFLEDMWCIKFDSGNYGSIMPGAHGFIKVIGNVTEQSKDLVLS